MFVLLDGYLGQSPTGDLDDMYTKILTHSITPGSQNQVEQSAQFKQIVGCIVVPFDTLPLVTLCWLLGIREEVEHLRLHHLHSVLDIAACSEELLQLIHSSFHDFLVNKD